jgi:hypothetical protein
VVVDDPQAAALVVANLDDAPPQVVLLPTKKLVNPLTVTPHAVIVQDYEGFRVTRLPSSPLVGAAARLGRIDALRERITALDMLESERLTEQEALRARRRRIQALQPEASWLDRGGSTAHICREAGAVDPGHGRPRRRWPRRSAPSTTSYAPCANARPRL